VLLRAELVPPGPSRIDWLPAIIDRVAVAVLKLVLRFVSICYLCELGPALCPWFELPCKAGFVTAPSPIVEFPFLYLMCSMKPLP